MSLFQTPQNRSITNPAQIIRQQVGFLEASPRRMTEQLLRQWEQAFDLMWSDKDGVTPAQRLAALGPDAAELFAANAALIGFICQLLKGRDDALAAKLAGKTAAIPPHTVHKDGTITLDA